MRFHRHVLPAQLRPVLRVAITVAAALAAAGLLAAAGIAALEEHARREREELRRAADAAATEQMYEGAFAPIDTSASR